MIENELINWQPTATVANLKKRSAIVAGIREFFTTRGVWEVDTPVMSHSTVTAPYVVGIPAIFQTYGTRDEQTCYLQTSPEYAMKRLLAAGSGPIFQLSKAFRQGEVGKLHNPEFTMLEWYRPGFDHHALMDEMDELLQKVLLVSPAERVSYGDLFATHLGIDAHNADAQQLADYVREKNIPLSSTLAVNLPDRDAWLDLLWTHCIEPNAGLHRPIFVYDYPKSQAALAKVRAGNPPLASRFEVYFKGIELANGFHELQDAAEQEKRFREDLMFRRENGMPPMPVDDRFLAALAHGLPDCAGVALGVDRLIMLALGCHTIAEVLSFSFETA